MMKVSPKEIRRRILLKLYEAYWGREEHTLTGEELREEIGVPEWVVGAALLYMDARGWMGSLQSDGLCISAAGVDVVENENRFAEEFGGNSNVILVIVDNEGSAGKGFEEVYEKVAGSMLSDDEKGEIRRLLEDIEKQVAKAGACLDGIGVRMAEVLKMCEWLSPVLSSVVCKIFLERLRM
jgi:hypothetical protein